MPIYEYRCADCGEVTEFLERWSSRARHACRSCGGEKLSKVFSVFNAPAGGGEGSCPGEMGPSPACARCSEESCPLG